MLQRATPILACDDVEQAITFCTAKLGFERDWVWGDPPSDGGVRRDSVALFFMRNAELAGRSRGTEVLIFVSGVDDLFAEHVERDAPIVSPLETKPWRLREYTVDLPAGQLLRFAERIEENERTEENEP